MKSVQAVILLTVLITSCMAAEYLETYSACMDHSIHESLQNKTVSQLQKQYKDYLMANNGSLTGRPEITIFDIISYAVNATGNISETLSRIGINRIGCLSYFKLTLKEVAFINLKVPDKFPGNLNMKELLDILTTNATESVLKEVQAVIKLNFENKTGILNKTIDEMIEMSNLSNQSNFLLLLGYAISATSVDQTAKELRLPKYLLDVTMIEMMEYLYTSSYAFQKEHSLELVIRLLHTARKWLEELWQFKKRERMRVQNKTLDDLFMEKGLHKANTTILTLLQNVFPSVGLNWTFAQYFGTRRVSLKLFNYTVIKWASITFMDADTLVNSTLLELFGSAFLYDELIEQYDIYISTTKSRKEMIMTKYSITITDLQGSPFNLTSSDITAFTDAQVETFATRAYLRKYAGDRNITLEKLEQMSNITTGKLANATVDNFKNVLFQIASSNVMRAISKERALVGIVPSITPLCLEGLKKQILKEWFPITHDWEKKINLSMSYHIHQTRLDPTKVLNMSFYDFVENHLSSQQTSFKDLLKLFPGIIYENHIVLEREFKKFTFGELGRFIGLQPYEIYNWKMTTFITKISMKILNDTNECDRKPGPCARIPGVTCLNHPFGFKCICPADKNLNVNKMCADINECQQRPILRPNCRNHSHCVNMNGSYECQCHHGFDDVNNTCTDIDECMRGTAVCRKNSRCNNTIGSYICPCNNGFQDVHNKCKDIDECRLGTATCRNNSRCKNTVGSYYCQCNSGFEDVNNTCEDIDECNRYNRICFNGIDNQKCINTVGSYICVCNPGFRFDNGFKVCIDINECVDQRPCSRFPNSYCQNKYAKYECKCPRGFRKHVDENGTLVNCTDINECSTGSDSCDKNAVCTNTKGSYICMCKDGYKGNGFKCKAERLFETPSGMKRRVTGKGKVRPPVKVYYNEQKHRKIYLSRNGMISFGKRYQSSPKQLTSLNKDLIAPFWSMTARDSLVTYFELQAGDEKASSLLNKINELVKNSTNEKSFDTSWAIVVTWEKVNPYWYSPKWWRRAFSPYTSETNTFQAVIAVDQSKTVVFFLYEDGGMNWRDDLGRVATVGYSTKTRRNGHQFPDSYQPKIFNIDQQDYTDPAGNVRKGFIIRLFKEITQQEASPEEKCFDWIRKESKGASQSWFNSLPQCPCDTNQMHWDPRFVWWFSSRDSVNGRRRCYITRRNFYSAKSCCYDDFGAVISSDTTRSGRAYRYGPANRNKYLQNEVEPFDWCCSLSTKYCQNFLGLRPLDEGCDADPDEQDECSGCAWHFSFRIKRRKFRRWMIRVRRAFFWGDPHITTVDGFKYTFNGLGDYVMLKTKDTENFNAIHTRTKRARNKNGGLSKATVFSGFALRSSKNTTVQVFFDNNAAGNLSITTVNKSMNCETFGFTDIDKHTIDGFTLTNRSNTLIVLYDSGLTAEITPGSDLLQYSLSIPTSNFENITEGLLGMLNENSNDDLALRNGTIVPINATEKEIFEFGNDWTVQPEERLFVNSTSCQKMPVFTSNFRPIFLSDVKDNITDEMRTTCKNNTECILDYFATGDRSFADATLKFETENNKIKKIFDNRPPSITTSPKEARVTVGQMITVNVTVLDPDNDPIIMLLGQGLSGLNATFSNTTASAGSLTWTPSPGLENVSIKFIAKDSNGASAVLTLRVLYCDCKNTGNTCDFATIQTSYANSSLSLVGCNCTDQYTGDQCETEINPCDDSPCYNNTICNVTRNPFGYKCGPCPQGREGDGEVCNDYDECLNSTRNNCTENEKCVNTIGSYRCDCKTGYSRDQASKKCLDVNECNSPFLGSYKCKANTDCENTPGSYNCSCKNGFKGDPLSTGCTDIDECQGDDRICFAQRCQNSVGSYNCSCYAGFELKKEGQRYSCKDKDECRYPADNNCQQKCINNQGSFTCGCNPGFQLVSDGSSCVVENSSKCDNTNGGCEELCTNSSGTVKCYCQRGFNLTSNGKNCDDINECMASNGGCGQTCNNYAGGYNCSCHRGYKLKGRRTCEDINECLTNNGDCAQKCHNEPGGRNCSCKRGYLLKTSDNKTCEDINECTDNTHTCGQYLVCNNSPGWYSCRCKDRTLFSDGKFKCKKSRKFRFSFSIVSITWVDDFDDEFSEKSISLQNTIIEQVGIFFRTTLYKELYLGCRVVGKFKRGSVQTNVSLNFGGNSTVSVNNVNNALANVSNIGSLRVDPSKSAVTDLDECSDPSLNNCHKDATCKNEPGTFSCSCKDGYKGDGISCEVSVIPKTKEDDDDRKIMIILLSTLIPLAVIIIIIIIFCCCKRQSKGNLHVETSGVQMYHTKNVYGSRSGGQREAYYDNARRDSDDSSNADNYDIAYPSSFGKQGPSAMYDVSQEQYYDNPGVSTESTKAV